MNKIARLCLLAGVFGIIAYPCVAADDQDDVRSSEHCCHTTHEVMNDPVFVEDSFFPKNNGYESFSSDRSSRCSAEDSFNIPAQNMFVPKSLGTIAIAYKGKEFYVINDKGEFLVQRYNLSKELREIDNEKLKKFISSGYLSLKKVGDEYAITHNFRLLGGGPVSGAVAYWLTKTLCYGTAVAAVTTVVVTTGGA
ncbi:MAG: hypothetical protein NT128_00015, partial [Proteobacteria bacterium]|nr:hypothetical protein [Pseudomonadota bacterium]